MKYEINTDPYIINFVYIIFSFFHCSRISHSCNLSHYIVIYYYFNIIIETMPKKDRFNMKHVILLSL